MVAWHQLTSYNHGQTSSDTFAYVGHMNDPSSYPTTKVGRVYPEFFSRVSKLYRVGERELPDIFEKVELL